MSTTTPASGQLPDLAATDNVIRDGRTYGYATVGDWVFLATDLSDRAVRIYGLLRMHCKAGHRAWPAQTTLALMLGIKKTDGVSAAIKELVDIGAVDVEVIKHSTGRRNIYTVHEAPPPDYTKGPRDRADFYRRREGVTPVSGGTPKRGITPETGVMGTPRNGGHGYPPKRGSEGSQGEVTTREVKPSVEADASTATTPHGDAGDATVRDLFGASSPCASKARVSTRKTTPKPSSDKESAGSAQQVVAAWVDAYKINLVRPSQPRIKQVGREAKSLLEAGNDIAGVIAAAESAARQGYATVDREFSLLAARAAGNAARPGSDRRGGGSRGEYQPYQQIHRDETDLAEACRTGAIFR